MLWNVQVAQDHWVEQQQLSAQQLRKPSCVVTLDATELPITLIDARTIVIAADCADAAAQLLPHLPPPESDDVLIALLDQLTHV